MGTEKADDKPKAAKALKKKAPTKTVAKTATTTKTATDASTEVPSKVANKIPKKKASTKAPTATKAVAKAAGKTTEKSAGKKSKSPALAAEAGEEADAPPPKKIVRGTGTLVIVESPAKAKTIKKYLGAGYVVKASVGHVKDLPKKKMGIDIENDFTPEYVVIEGKKKVLDEITAAAKVAGRVLLAPDPDREGEAIAWHLAEEMRSSNPNIMRVLFNEITKKAITESISRPMELNVHKFESQQARRILDRLVGYQISPVLWTKVKRG